MIPSSSDVIAITLSFFTEVKGRELDARGKIDVPNEYKRRIMDEVAALMAGGHSAFELADIFSRTHPKRAEVYSVKELFDLYGEACTYGRVEADPDNLLSPGTFYYHPFLQSTPGAPKVRTDDDGNMFIVEEPFFLEMKDRLTLEQLHDELRGHFGWGPLSKKYTGAYKYVLERHTVEELLFMSDCARADMDTNGMKPPMSPLRLLDYEAEMAEAIESRKNICHEGGLSHVIPRRRRQDPVN